MGLTGLLEDRLALKQSLIPKSDSRLDNVCPEEAKVAQHWYGDGGTTSIFDH